MLQENQTAINNYAKKTQQNSLKIHTKKKNVFMLSTFRHLVARTHWYGMTSFIHYRGHLGTISSVAIPRDFLGTEHTNFALD